MQLKVKLYKSLALPIFLSLLFNLSIPEIVKADNLTIESESIVLGSGKIQWVTPIKVLDGEGVSCNNFAITITNLNLKVTDSWLKETEIRIIDKDSKIIGQEWEVGIRPGRTVQKTFCLKPTDVRSSLAPYFIYVKIGELNASREIKIENLSFKSPSPTPTVKAKIPDAEFQALSMRCENIFNSWQKLTASIEQWKILWPKYEGAFQQFSDLAVDSAPDCDKILLDKPLSKETIASGNQYVDSVQIGILKVESQFEKFKITILGSKTPSSNQKKTTIICVKGKLTKKITAVKPKCPTGYKKK
jgi:hypothetical protein